MRKTKFFAALCCTAMLFAACEKSEPTNNSSKDPINQDQEQEQKDGDTAVLTGTENGHDWVDLGLPSGLKWATCNIGATKPEDYGNYYAWGEILTKTNYSWETYIHGTSDSELTKYCNRASYGKDYFFDSIPLLDWEDDAAAVNWGGKWRMPTKDEWQELLDNCTSVYIDDYQNTGVPGIKFSSKNGNFIFIPNTNFIRDSELIEANETTDCYWSSSYSFYCPSNACTPSEWYAMRYEGRVIRPVFGADAKIPEFTIDRSLPLPEPQEPTDGSYLIVVQINAPICEGNDIVFVGNYKMSSLTDWETDPNELVKLKPYDSYEFEGVYKNLQNWYYAKIDYSDYSEPLQGKFVQLTNYDEFNWSYQSGEPSAWTVVSGDVEIEASLYSGESEVTWNSKLAIVKFDKWKNGANPCVEPQDYVVNVKCEDFVPYIAGNFNSWEHEMMTLVDGTDDTYTYTLYSQIPGNQFKITTGDWLVEVLMKDAWNEASSCYEQQYNTTLESGKNTLNFEVAGLNTVLTMCEEY